MSNIKLSISKRGNAASQHAVRLENKSKGVIDSITFDLGDAIVHNLVFSRRALSGQHVKYAVSHDKKRLTVHFSLKPGQHVEFGLDVDTVKNSHAALDGIELTGMAATAVGANGVYSSRLYKGSIESFKSVLLPSEDGDLSFFRGERFNTLITNKDKTTLVRNGLNSVTQVYEKGLPGAGTDNRKVYDYTNLAGRGDVSTATEGISYLAGSTPTGTVSNSLTIDKRDTDVLIGTRSDDLIIGSGKHYGGEGDDKLLDGFVAFGGAGDDVLAAGDRGGYLAGGAGSDAFAIGNTHGVTHVVDFETGEKLYLGQSVREVQGQFGWDKLYRNQDNVLVGAVKFAS